MHKVESGETLAMIGKRYGASPSVIAAANRMESAAPETGDRLVIPQAAAVRPTVLRKPAGRRPVASVAHKGAVKRSRGKSSLAARPGTKGGVVAKASHKKSSSAGRI
jgi:LysM repeat protein